MKKFSLFLLLLIPLGLNSSQKERVSIKFPKIATSTKFMGKLIHIFNLEMEKEIIQKQNRYILQTLKNKTILIGTQKRGCTLTAEGITFHFRSTNKNSQIYVLGNFNDWELFDPFWELKYDSLANGFTITYKQFKLPDSQLSNLKSELNNLKFIFYVDGEYVFK